MFLLEWGLPAAPCRPMAPAPRPPGLEPPLSIPASSTPASEKNLPPGTTARRAGQRLNSKVGPARVGLNPLVPEMPALPAVLGAAVSAILRTSVIGHALSDRPRMLRTLLVQRLARVGRDIQHVSHLHPRLRRGPLIHLDCVFGRAVAGDAGFVQWLHLLDRDDLARRVQVDDVQRDQGVAHPE